MVCVSSNIHIVSREGEFNFFSASGLEGFFKGVLVAFYFAGSLGNENLGEIVGGYGFSVDSFHVNADYEATFFPESGKKGVLIYRDFLGSQTPLRFLENEGVRIIPYNSISQREALIERIMRETLITS